MLKNKQTNKKQQQQQQQQQQQNAKNPLKVEFFSYEAHNLSISPFRKILNYNQGSRKLSILLMSDICKRKFDSKNINNISCDTVSPCLHFPRISLGLDRFPWNPANELPLHLRHCYPQTRQIDDN